MAVNIEQLEKASRALKIALDEPLTDITRDAIIQRFEFCVELAWKAVKKKMGSPSVAPKSIMREAAQQGLIDNPEAWILYIDARNMSSHTYNEELAKKVLETVIKFYPDLEQLLRGLRVI